MEFDLSKLLDYGIGGIALAILGVLFYVFKTFMQFVKESDQRHAEVKSRFVESINQNTEMINVNTKTLSEIGQYIKLKNGSFEKLIEKTNNTLNDCPVHNKRRK
jgi:hypothetical protein